MQSLSTHTLSRLSPCVFHFDTYDKLSDPLFSPSLSMRESTRFCTWSRAKWNRKKLLPSILKSACFPPSIEPARRGKDYQFIIYNLFRCFPSTNAVVRGMTRKEGCSYANSSGRSGKSLSMSGRMEGQGGFEYRQQGRISRKRKGRRLKQFSHGLERWIRRLVRREYQGIWDFEAVFGRASERSRWRMGLSCEGEVFAQGQLRKKMDALGDGGRGYYSMKVLPVNWKCFAVCSQTNARIRSASFTPSARPTMVEKPSAFARANARFRWVIFLFWFFFFFFLLFFILVYTRDFPSDPCVSSNLEFISITAIMVRTNVCFISDKSIIDYDIIYLFAVDGNLRSESKYRRIELSYNSWKRIAALGIYLTFALKLEYTGGN